MLPKIFPFACMGSKQRNAFQICAAEKIDFYLTCSCYFSHLGSLSRFRMLCSISSPSISEATRKASSAAVSCRWLAAGDLRNSCLPLLKGRVLGSMKGCEPIWGKLGNLSQTGTIAKMRCFFSREKMLLNKVSVSWDQNWRDKNG